MEELVAIKDELVDARGEPLVFDDTTAKGDIYELELNPGLSPQLLKLANRLKRMTRGVMIVTGMVGAGKDLFGNRTSWLLKTIFKGKKVFRDEPPRRLYGAYEPFDEMTVMKEFAQVAQEIRFEVPKEIHRYDVEAVKKVADLSNQWMSRVGERILTNSVLYLTEFHRYMHNRRAFSPMGILIGKIIKRWRHLDLLIIGTAVLKRELDSISCNPYVTHEVRCSWSLKNPNMANYKIFPVKWVSSAGVFQVRGKKVRLSVDGSLPREFLGGKRYFDLFNSKSRGTTFGGITNSQEEG